MDKMRQFKKLIRKFKYITYVVIGIIGLVMIIFSFSYFSEEKGNITYDILMGIGCSVFATAVVTLILLLVLPDNSEDNAELKAWGIVKIYDERKDTAFPSNKIPKSKLDYVAFGLKHFRTANRNSAQLIRNIQNGLHVRILALHPDSGYVKKQEKFENIDGLKSDIDDLYNWVNYIASRLSTNSKGSIEIKFYDNLPLQFYCRADSRIWVGPYLPNVSSNNVITYEFQVDSKGGKYFEDTFQDYWDQKNDINIVKREKNIILGNQRKSIESVLKYFADEMKKEDGDDVIGVVVLFKDVEKLRRTLYSCNKPNQERYNCYKIDKGAVGKLICLNEVSTSAMFFRDYANNISITSSRQGREKVVEKIDFTINPFKKSTDMSAILAAPIYDGSKMIGAVTFDFHKLSSKYTTGVDTLSKLECKKAVDSGSILHQWFDMAEACAGIITNMLGNEVEISYQELYEEEWKINET